MAKREKFNLWIGTQDDPDSRLKIRVSNADLHKVDRSELARGEIISVTDLNTGRKYKVKRVPCGLDCWCALELA